MQANPISMKPWAFEERPILIVEDNPRERELIASSLTGFEISRNVIAMARGLELMDYLARRGRHASRTVLPALVILDLELEDAHGLDLLKAIRHDSAMAAVPVVIFSGSDSALDAAVARELRADGFIVKPTDFHDFQNTVRSLAVFWASHVRTTVPTGTSNND